MRLQQLEDDHFRFPDLSGVLYIFIKNPAASFSDRRKRAAGFYSTFDRRYVIMCMTQLHRKERGWPELCLDSFCVSEYISIIHHSLLKQYELTEQFRFR